MKYPVAIVKNDGARYPDEPPFHPAEAYPEYPFGVDHLGRENAAYESNGIAFRLFGGAAASLIAMDGLPLLGGIAFIGYQRASFCRSSAPTGPEFSAGPSR